MDVSREFICPKCKRSLTMSDSMHALALIHGNGGSYIATGTVETVTCPACGHQIPVREIIAGKHSAGGGAIETVLGCAGAIGMLVGIVYLVRSCS